MTDSDSPLFTSRRHRARANGIARPVIGSVLVLLLALAAGWWWTSSRGDDASGAAHRMDDPQAPDNPAVHTAAAGDEPVPELDASDDFVRRVVAGVSARPQLATWLVNEGLARRFVLAVVQVAHGRSPSHQLDFMAPDGRFRSTTADGRQVIDPASYHRYDALAATLASVDTKGTAEAFRRLHPLFEKAYADLGLKDQTFDETVAMAFDRILSVQVPDEPLEVEPQSAVYGFTSKELEGLSPVQKQLIRTGPENARRIQAKLRELSAALDLDVRRGADTPSPYGAS